MILPLLAEPLFRFGWDQAGCLLVCPPRPVVQPWHLALFPFSVWTPAFLTRYVFAVQTQFRNNCVLSNCSEGAEKKKKRKSTTQSKQSQSSLAGEAAGNSGTALPARWKPSSPMRRQRVQAARPSTRSLFTKLPHSSSQTASMQVRASLPACVQLVSGQKLLFQLLIGGQEYAKLGIFFF